MFGLKGRDTFNDPVGKTGRTIKLVQIWWIKLFKYILVFMAVFVVAVLVYFWHSYLYQKEISNEEIDKYIKVKMKEVLLEEKKFDDVHSLIDNRAEHFNASRSEYNDVFYETVVSSEGEERLTE